MALPTESLVFGTRLYAESGLTYANPDGPIATEPKFNHARVTASGHPLASTLTGSGVWFDVLLPRPMILSQVHLEVRDVDNQRVAAGFVFSYVHVGGAVTTAAVANGPSLHTSTQDAPSDLMEMDPVTKVRLNFSSAPSGFRVAALHLYAHPMEVAQTASGLWMSDHTYGLKIRKTYRLGDGSTGEAWIREMDPVPRKLGQSFDAGPTGRGGSSHGEFYIYNSGEKGDAIAPVLHSASPGDATARPGYQHLLFSLDRLTWSSHLVLPTITAQTYSPRIHYIDTCPADTTTGRVSVRAVATPDSWSSGEPVTADESMVATFFKTVTTATPAPDLWWADPMQIAPGASVTLWGTGLANRTWSVWRRGAHSWHTVAVSPAVGSVGHTVEVGDDSLVVRGQTSISSNVAAQYLSLTMPEATTTALFLYSVKAASANGAQEDVFHGIRVIPPLTGDLGLPPLIMKSETAAAMRPVGLTPGGYVEQREMVFAKPKAIITSLPRSRPKTLINSHASIQVIASTQSAGRIGGVPDLNTSGMHRFYPSAATMVPRPELGPTKMAWVALSGSRQLVFDTAGGPYIDPEVDIETSEEDTSILTPAMVFPSGAHADATMAFPDVNLFPSGKAIPSYTMLMVVLLGPDPSPTYREVVTGQPERLSTLPAHLMGTTSIAAEWANTAMRYDKRFLMTVAGKARPRIPIDYGFLGQRPIIVGITLGRYDVGKSHIPYSRMTVVGDRVRRREISGGPFSAFTHARIGHTGHGATFRVLDFLLGPRLGVPAEDRMINRLDAIYGVMK